jgi:hypothetical protein
MYHLDTRKVLARWPDDIRQRVMYADGCGDPESCLTALEVVLQSGVRN